VFSSKNIKAKDPPRGDNAVCLGAVFSILYEGEPKTGLSLGRVVYHGRCLFYVFSMFRGLLAKG
jgi:hypothetical protein